MAQGLKFSEFFPTSWDQCKFEEKPFHGGRGVDKSVLV